MGGRRRRWSFLGGSAVGSAAPCTAAGVQQQQQEMKQPFSRHPQPNKCPAPLLRHPSPTSRNSCSKRMLTEAGCLQPSSAGADVLACDPAAVNEGQAFECAQRCVGARSGTRAGSVPAGGSCRPFAASSLHTSIGGATATAMRQSASVYVCRLLEKLLLCRALREDVARGVCFLDWLLSGISPSLNKLPTNCHFTKLALAPTQASTDKRCSMQ